MRNSPKPYIFFSFNNFSKQDGGPVRMYGILNSIARSGKEVVFYSNAKSYENFHPKIKHISLNLTVEANQKRKIQFLLATLPYQVCNIILRRFIKKLQLTLANHANDTIFFFEYLDNSIGYWLYKNKIIADYINDIHGIGPLEFQYQKINTSGINYQIYNLKENIAYKLDQKVMSNAKYNIFASEKMYNYFIKIYPNLKNQRKVVIPNLLSEDAFNRQIDEIYRSNFMQNHKISSQDFIIMFAGSFKLIGGVLDLIKAFEVIQGKYPNCKLLLIGDGPEKENCEQYVEEKFLKQCVFFTGKTPYHLLATYQSLAHVIVCPEQENPYSHLIIHLKYLDSLLANKVIIAGNFESIKEINPTENLSLEFIPSDIESLSNTIEKTILNYAEYIKKYQDNKTFAFHNLTYSKYIAKYNFK